MEAGGGDREQYERDGIEPEHHAPAERIDQRAGDEQQQHRRQRSRHRDEAEQPFACVALEIFAHRRIGRGQQRAVGQAHQHAARRQPRQRGDDRPGGARDGIDQQRRQDQPAPPDPLGQRRGQHGTRDHQHARQREDQLRDLRAMFAIVRRHPRQPGRQRGEGQRGQARCADTHDDHAGTAPARGVDAVRRAGRARCLRPDHSPTKSSIARLNASGCSCCTK